MLCLAKITGRVNGVIMQFNIHYAKTNLSRLLELVERGEEVVIARAGKPVGRIVLCEAASPASTDSSIIASPAPTATAASPAARPPLAEARPPIPSPPTDTIDSGAAVAEPFGQLRANPHLLDRSHPSPPPTNTPPTSPSNPPSNPSSPPPFRLGRLTRPSGRGRALGSLSGKLWLAKELSLGRQQPTADLTSAPSNNGDDNGGNNGGGNTVDGGGSNHAPPGGLAPSQWRNPTV